MSEGQSLPGATFYRIDSSRFTMREYAWGTKNPLTLLIAFFLKLFRVNLGGSIDDPAVDAISPFEVSEDSLPEEVRAKFAPLQAELAQLGFGRPIFHQFDDRLNFTSIYWATCVHSSSRAVARIHCRIWRKPHPHKFHLFPTFISIFEDGSTLFSSSGKPDSELPKSVRVLRQPGMPASELWRAHETELHRLPAQAIPCRDEHAARQVVESFHLLARDFHLKRGAFKPLGESDSKESEILAQSRTDAAARGAANPEVLAEIDLLQKAPRTWKNSLWLLLITGLAFVLAGGARGNFKSALLLIPILLFHELGHYVAMYIFKYRNLKMFFIPFLGAAVTGQNYNVAAWKKLIVFLMGPVPGILLGAGLGFAGIARGNDLAVNAGLLCIVINGFNLLPLLPLDGGHVVNLVLFSRHYILDTVFRILAAIGLIVVAFGLDAKLLMYFGFFSLIAVGGSFKQSKVTEAVRGMGLPGPIPGTDAIPPETADTIVTELKKQFPKGLTSKQLAERALSVFETLNSRPPGWVASVFYLAIHAASFAFGFLAMGFIVLYHRGELSEAFFGERIEMTVSRSSLETRISESARSLDPTNSVAIVATFEKLDKAREEFNRLSADLPDTAASVLFGHTLYLRLPATNMQARSSLFDTLSQSTTNLFLERTNYRPAFSFRFLITPTNAVSPWFRDFQAFWNNNTGNKLIPPWTEVASISPDLKKEFNLARQTVTRLYRADDSTSDNDRDEADRKALTAALRIGDTAKVEEIQKKQQERRDVAFKIKLDQLKALPPSEIHRDVLEAYFAYPSDTNRLPAWRESRTNLARMMGSIAQHAPDAWRNGVDTGFLMTNKLSVSLLSVQFADFLHGAPPLIRWLEEHNVQELRYSVDGVSTSHFDDQE